MFRDPGTTEPHRLKKWKDRSALVPVLAVLAGQRASFPNASGFACRNPATTPAQRAGWVMRRETIPLRPSRSAGPVRHGRPGSARPAFDRGFPVLRASGSRCWAALGFSRRVVLFCLESTNGPSGPL